MIRDTLELLRNSTRSMTDMAERLGVGMEDLRQRLRILEDKGFIQRVTGPDGRSPIKCPGCRGAGCFSHGYTYVLTEKGKKVVESG